MKDLNSRSDGVKLSLNKLDEESPKDALGYATAYVGMGASVVPNDGKRPMLKGWTEDRLREVDLPLHFDNGQNVGVLNGEPSGWLIAVDIDVPEAREASDQFLPKTVRSGRTGTPYAHAWYRTPGARTRKYQDTDGAMLLEIRSTGCQTLVPPSVHPNGERYGWHPDGISEPAEMTVEELERHCAELATAAVVARHVPPVGGRHEYAKAVIGLLTRRLGSEAALKMAREAWRAAGADGAEALRDLEGIASDTERRLSEGDDVVGLPTLSGLVPGLPGLLGRWWGWPSEGPAATDGTAASAEKPTEDELRDRWIEGRQSPTAYGQGEWRRYAGASGCRSTRSS